MTRVVIRADASRVMGTGHVMRCVTLATALRVRGAEVTFVSRMHEGHLASIIEDRGFGMIRLPIGRIENASASASATWWGADWKRDADETREAIGHLGEIQWLIVDHYGIDHRWEACLRPAATRLLVIDDLADRPHDCDLLLDQNLVPCWRTRYDALVSESCALLLGPTYAMLQPAYRELRREVRPRSGAIRRILISFGGSDPDNLTSLALTAFLELHRAEVHADVVLGPANPWGPSLREQSAGHANVTIHAALPTLAPLLRDSDLAIGGAGTTSWERLCLGVPSLVVTQAENQRSIAEAMSDHELVQWLGDATTVSKDTVVAALRPLLDRGLTADWSRRCLEVVDGQGVDRVAAAVMVTGETAIRVRNATAHDEALLLEWANDRVTRQNAFSTAAINAAEHHIWLRRRLGDPANCRIYIGETLDGIGVGQVRFDRSRDDWRISYALAPQFRGRRLGRRLLHLAMCEMALGHAEAMFLAEVKESNVASRRVFDSLGFTPAANGEKGIAYRRPARSA